MNDDIPIPWKVATVALSVAAMAGSLVAWLASVWWQRTCVNNETLFDRIMEGYR